MNSTAVKILNLCKVYKKTRVLDNINLIIERGQIIGITGRNGSGKSMLFKAICGLITPTSGEIVVFDKLISNGNFPEKTGVIIESPGLLPQYSAFTNLKILASINHTVTSEEIKSAIKLVGLDPEDKKPVKNYSLGMKQRLGIAQAIMEKPQLLILDEPMNGLDSDGVSDIRNLILKFKEQGVTVILASHNSEDIKTLCDNVYVIDSGKISPKKN